MSDLLVAVTPGEHRFDPDQIAAAAARQWPSVEDVDITGPELVDLARLLSKQLTINDGQRTIVAGFHADNRGIGIEGDDELEAEFLAFLTQNTELPGEEIVVVQWADDIVTLRPSMTLEDVQALRD